MVLFHRLAIFVQLLVCEFVERVGTLRADDDLGLILLFNDGLGRSDQLSLQGTHRKRRKPKDVNAGWVWTFQTNKCFYLCKWAEVSQINMH